MKKQIWKVVLWTCMLWVLMGPCREYLDFGNFQEAFGNYYKPGYEMLSSWNFRLINILYAVSLYLIFFYFYPKRETWKIIGSVLLMAILIIGYRYLFEEVIMVKLTGHGNYNPNTTMRHYFLDNLYYIVLYGHVGLVVYFLQSSAFNERLKNEYLLDMKKSELLFLKSQVNPHFLFNSLNNIYSLVFSKSDKALDSVSKLSSMLRYTLYENEEWIPLAKEISYIKDFIELERVRLPYDLACEVDIDEDLLSHEVTPYILIPFVENAFKHGVLSDPAHPVIIKLEQVGNDLHFMVENKYEEKQKDKVGGIGVANVKKRLAYVYNERHDLKINNDRDSYKVHLIIHDLC